MPATANSQELKPNHGTVCWALNFSGSTLGVTSDSEVERLLDKGVAHKNEGDRVGRYFIDEGHTATLHAVSCTDSIVGELKQAENKWFKPTDGFEIGMPCTLAPQRDDVLKT